MPQKKITKKWHERSQNGRGVVTLTYKPTTKPKVMNPIPQSITVTVGIQYADICQSAFQKYFTSQGKQESVNSVTFDFKEDADEFKQALIEQFSVTPAEIKTIIKFK